MRRILNFLNKVFNNEPTIHYVDVLDLLKNNPGHLPKDLMLRLPSLSERIKSIPYQTLSDDLLWEIWDKALTEMNRRKSNRSKQNEQRI